MSRSLISIIDVLPNNINGLVYREINDYYIRKINEEFSIKMDWNDGCVIKGSVIPLFNYRLNGGLTYPLEPGNHPLVYHVKWCKSGYPMWKVPEWCINILQ